MRFTTTFCAIALFTFLGSSASAQSFKAGDKVIDLNVGIGIAKTDNASAGADDAINTSKETKTTFNQRIGMEFGVCNFSDKASLGVGFSFNNGVYSTHQLAQGTYDYEYHRTSYIKRYDHRDRWEQSINEWTRRQGSGSALAKATIDELSLLTRISFHYSLSERLDTYIGVGFGIARLHYIYSDFSHEKGFSSANKPFDENYNSTYQICEVYNDLDHVKWNNGGTTSRFAVAGYIGARYYLTSHCGINLEVGLPCATLMKDFNNYNFASIGFSYRF